MITHTGLNVGPVVLLTRFDPYGWVWVHMKSLAKGFRVQAVHLSNLRADDGLNEMLEATYGNPVIGSAIPSADALAMAVNEATVLGLEP